MEARAKAFETDDDALRCYIDQLPTDRCLCCATATQPRMIHVAGPLHRPRSSRWAPRRTRTTRDTCG